MNGTFIYIKMQLYLIITNNEVKDVPPNKKGESSVVLLLSKIIRENISNLNLKEDDTISAEKEEFDKLLFDLEKRKMDMDSLKP